MFWRRGLRKLPEQVREYQDRWCEEQVQVERGCVSHGDDPSNDSDERGNGGDERENELENLDLMSATARRPLTNTDEGER